MLLAKERFGGLGYVLQRCRRLHVCHKLTPKPIKPLATQLNHSVCSQGDEFLDG